MPVSFVVDNSNQREEIESSNPSLNGGISRESNGEALESIYFKERKLENIYKDGDIDPYSSISSVLVLETPRKPVPTHLLSGSTFSGSQKSGKSCYNVHIEIKHCSMEDSFICGYLKIKGLTDDWPSLCTFFEGEIIGEKHHFLTRKWEASEHIDRQHWTRFPSFKANHELLQRLCIQVPFNIQIIDLLMNYMCMTMKRMTSSI